MAFPMMFKPSLFWNWTPQIWCVKSGFPVEGGRREGMLNLAWPSPSEYLGCLPDWLVLLSHQHAPFTPHSLTRSKRIGVLWLLRQLLNWRAPFFRSNIAGLSNINWHTMTIYNTDFSYFFLKEKKEWVNIQVQQPAMFIMWQSWVMRN